MTTTSNNALEEKKSDTPDVLAVGLGNSMGSEAEKKEDVPQAPRRATRVRKDKQGSLIVKRTIWVRPDIYKKYKDLAYHRGEKLYDYIGEALEAYYPELKKHTTQKLREAGQEELDV